MFYWFQVVGFLIYTIPYHPLVLVVGRTICGVGDCFPSVISGDLFRIYTEEESTRAALWLHSTYSFGFLFGPSLSFMFEGEICFFRNNIYSIGFKNHYHRKIRLAYSCLPTKFVKHFKGPIPSAHDFLHFSLCVSGLDIRIGPFEVNKLNFVGFFMAGLSLLVLFISHFFAYICSSVLDLKAIASLQEATKSKEVGDVVILSEKAQEIEQREKGSKNEQISINEEDSLHTIYEEVEPDLENLNGAEGHSVSSPPSVSTTIHELLTNKDSVLIFVSSFLFMYTIFSADLLLPLIVADTLTWKQTTLSAIYFGWGAIDLVFLLLIGKVCTSSRYAPTIVHSYKYIFAILYFLRLVRSMFSNAIKKKSFEFQLSPLSGRCTSRV